MLCVALAVLASGSAELAIVATVAVLALFITRPDEAPPRRQITFSVERLKIGAAAVPAALAIPENPGWVGRWRLDFSCSDNCEPILAAVGVPYMIRKIANSIRAGCVISVCATHLKIVHKSLIPVEDRIPVDGSWLTKPMPPGGRMKGEFRVRLTKTSKSELELYTVLPEGELREKYLVFEDGNSFSRTVVIG